MAKEQRTSLKGPSIHISVFIPSSDTGVVPARGVFSATVPLTAEVREFLGGIVDQQAWTRQRAPQQATWADIEEELGVSGWDSETPHP